MAKALIYGEIYAGTARLFSESLSDIEESGSDLQVRVNSNGGNPEYGWGMISQVSEFPNAKSLQIEGKAYSMGLFAAMYVDKKDVSCYDVSQGLLHRASYGEWFESSSYFTDALKTNLANINSKLMEASKARLDIPKLEAIMDKKPETKGKKFKDIWSMDGVLDVFLTSKEMKSIGLVGKVTKLTPTKSASINARIIESAAMFQGNHNEMMLPEVKASASNPKNANTNNNDMTPEEIQAKIDTAVDNAVKAEKNKVAGWLPFLAIDPEAVRKGIESGESIMENQAIMADLMIKMNDPKRASAATAQTTNTENPDGNDNPDTGNPVVSELDAAQASVSELLNPKTQK